MKFTLSSDGVEFKYFDEKYPLPGKPAVASKSEIHYDSNKKDGYID